MGHVSLKLCSWIWINIRTGYILFFSCSVGVLRTSSGFVEIKKKPPERVRTPPRAHTHTGATRIGCSSYRVASVRLMDLVKKSRKEELIIQSRELATHGLSNFFALAYPPLIIHEFFFATLFIVLSLYFHNCFVVKV